MSRYGTREQKKWGAVRRAQFALGTALRRIDYMEDVVGPELDALGAGTATLSQSDDYDLNAASVLAPLELEA